MERNNKYNKTMTAKMAEGIAASLPNNVSAVTTENPELLMVSSNTWVIDRPGFIPIFLADNSKIVPIPNVVANKTIVDNNKTTGLEKKTSLFIPTAVKIIMANPQSTTFPRILATYLNTGLINNNRDKIKGTKTNFIISIKSDQELTSAFLAKSSIIAGAIAMDAKKAPKTPKIEYSISPFKIPVNGITATPGGAATITTKPRNNSFVGINNQAKRSTTAPKTK